MCLPFPFHLIDAVFVPRLKIHSNPDQNRNSRLNRKLQICIYIFFFFFFKLFRLKNSIILKISSSPELQTSWEDFFGRGGNIIISSFPSRVLLDADLDFDPLSFDRVLCSGSLKPGGASSAG